MYELVTIAFSHYCEKARWALDRYDVPYRERRFMPALHFPYVIGKLAGTGAGKADRASTRFSTPLLLGASRPIADSSDIVRYVDERYGNERLFGDPEAAALDAHFGLELGPHTRRVAYWLAMGPPSVLDELARANVSPAQARLFRTLRPLALGFVAKRLAVDEAGYRRSLEKVRREVDRVGARIVDGRPYLLGDRISVADLSFASLMGPALVPAEYGAVLGDPATLGEEARTLIEEMRAHPAGQFALRLFREERRKRTRPA